MGLGPQGRDPKRLKLCGLVTIIHLLIVGTISLELILFHIFRSIVRGGEIKTK